MKEPQKRVAWIDMAKGYGIILMIIGHLHVNELMVWIYSFHMPLFFFVSGYLFNIKSSFLEFSAGKVKRMLIPYLFLYIPMLLADLLITGTLSTGQVLEHLRLNLLQQRHSALWFLGCLIVLHFLYYPIVRYVTNRIIGAIITIMLGLTGVILWRNGVTGFYWNFDVAMVAAPFFYGGFLLRGRINETRIRKMKKAPLAAALLSLLAASALTAELNCHYFLGREIDLFESLFREELLSYTAAFIGISFIILLAARWSVPFVKYIGKHSLLFYAWHYPVVILPMLKLCQKMGIVHLNSGWSGLMQNVVLLIATLAVLTILNELVIRTRLRFITGR